MDKLQPFIKYHFWLLFVPAFIMPPAAWWMTTSSLQATIDERTTALDSAFDSIPKGTDTPNKDWIDKANAQIGIRTETNIRTVDRLWDWQKTLVKWPPNVAKYMDSCEYRKDITDPAISRRVPIDYRRDYPLEVRRVWLLADPIGHAADPIPPKAAKKVWFPLDNMPQVSAEKWRNLPPSFIEIWNSQEDLWLLEQILLAVQRTNSSSNSITDSFVRQIQEVALFGGDRVKPGDAPAATAVAKTGDESGMPGSPMGFPPAMGRRGSGHQVPSSARFDLAEEFAPKGLASKSRSPMNNMMPGPEMTGDGKGNSTASGADDLNLDENRYITVADAYRTRGFQLVVTVHQQYVPDLVRELLNSQYPISIARIEQAALHPDEPDGSSTDPRGGPSMKSMASSSPGGPGVDTSAYADPSGGAPDTGGNTGSSEDSFSNPEDSFSNPTEDASRVPITDEAVAAALDELDLVEVMIVGELYLYNPPPVSEGDKAATGTTGTEAPATGAPATGDPTVQPEGVVQPEVTEPDTTTAPTTPAAPGETEGAPAPATPETPAPVTPKPATPSPASAPPSSAADTSTPEPVKPGTPEPVKPGS